MNKIMPKKVFGNISNISHHNSNIYSTKLGTKRTNDDDANQVNKRIKPTEEDKNHNIGKRCLDIENEQNEPYDDNLTRSIEKKVKRIRITTDLSTSKNISLKEDPVTHEEAISEPIGSNELNDTIPDYIPPPNLPPGVEDFDLLLINDITAEPHYAYDIFQYYRKKEIQCPTKKYMKNQKELTKGMRAVLVDWMVEVQESFELNHETLYLAVKIMDQYLMRKTVQRCDLQLLAITAMLIAIKFDDRIFPEIDDFLYLCDDAYTKDHIILMEIEVLSTLDFYIGYPLSYRFLRRYSRCARFSMELLTLARYALETSLMEYDLIEERDSKMAAAALLLALKMKYPGDKDVWSPTLQFYSSYQESELTPLMYKLNDLISATPKSYLTTIKTKYSHKTFFEVANIPPLKKELGSTS